MNVPFLDLKAQYLSLRNELDSAIQQVIDDTAFAGGPYVEKFEQEFSAYCQCSAAAGVSSGTNALHLALLALNIGPGDEVITAANTFTAVQHLSLPIVARKPTRWIRPQPKLRLLRKPEPSFRFTSSAKLRIWMPF